MTTTAIWRALLAALLDNDAIEIAPDSLGGEWRGRTTRELLAHTTVVPMTAPIVLCPGRFPEGRGYRFMVAEAAWILSGDNRLETIEPYARALTKLSDDGRTLGGAYGPLFVEQEPFVVNALVQDRASRQAVLTIWRPRPQLGGSDIPCTVSLQWLIRPSKEKNVSDELHCIATMRSSDAWMGWVFDVFTFSAMSAFIALDHRRRAGSELSLGNLHLTAGSQHLYKVDFSMAEKCVDRSRDDLIKNVQPIDINEFNRPGDLVNHLWCLAKRDKTSHFYLNDLFNE